MTVPQAHIWFSSCGERTTPAQSERDDVMTASRAYFANPPVRAAFSIRFATMAGLETMTTLTSHVWTTFGMRYFPWSVHLCFLTRVTSRDIASAYCGQCQIPIYLGHCHGVQNVTYFASRKAIELVSRPDRIPRAPFVLVGRCHKAEPAHRDYGRGVVRK